MKDSLDVIEWVAFFIGTLGNVVWATNSKHSKWASLFWFISSILWISFASEHQHYGLLLSNVVSLAIYIYGIKQWLLTKIKFQS